MDVQHNRIKFSYDRESDVLYSYIDKPRPAFGEEEESGIIIRYDMTTNEIVGFTIINYSRRFHRDMTIPHFPGLALPTPESI